MSVYASPVYFHEQQSGKKKVIFTGIMSPSYQEA
jgi:hypothetical protein